MNVSTPATTPNENLRTKLRPQGNHKYYEVREKLNLNGFAQGLLAAVLAFSLGATLATSGLLDAPAQATASIISGVVK